ncbi:MAG: GspE/PulE family protein [Candidatus Falkowbacteria bacterium]
MPKDLPSVEDLISASRGVVTDDDQNAQVKLAAKQADITKKNIEHEAKQLAEQVKQPYFYLVKFPISPEALQILPEDEARRLNLLCFFYDGAKLNFATTDPSNPEVKEVIDKMYKRYHCKGELFIISINSLKYGLDAYNRLPKHSEVRRSISITQEDLEKYSDKFTSFTDLQTQIVDGNVTEILNAIMAAGVKSGTSDCHIEAEELDIKVRFRLDGVLHDVASLDAELWKKIISRLKSLAGVKINVGNKPQDGRITINTARERVDIRASFLPTNFGESVVMRFLRSSSVGLTFEQLGLRSNAFELLKKQIERPNGMIITTGPTGSGKTTTLYAILKKLNDSETKIITIEDPIEYQLKGINQSQTNPTYSFGQALRSIVRQDPDIIMVGEIRDLETAEVAIQAALTGHLVLSTIHTNDAAGAIPRFLSMGAKGFLLAPAINAVIGQRLIRKICDGCKNVVEPSADHLEKAKQLLENLPAQEQANYDLDKLVFYTGTGCEKCQGIGYKGRLGIYEIMTMNAEIEQLILTGKVSEYQMRDIAAKGGMVTMVQDGVVKAVEGLTSLDEVFRVAE